MAFGSKKNKKVENIEKEQVSENSNMEQNIENEVDVQDIPTLEGGENCDCIDQDDEITLLKKIIEEMKDKQLRLQAEFDNFRKRTLREKSDLIKSGGESVLVSVLPVIDDFDRAYAHIDGATDIEGFKEGFSLIYNKMRDFLTQNGVKEIEWNDKDFDTEYHEAITKIPAPTKELKGKVVDCIQKGYTLNDKVIRYSKVVIGE